MLRNDFVGFRYVGTVAYTLDSVKLLRPVPRPSLGGNPSVCETSYDEHRFGPVPNALNSSPW